MSVCLAPDSRTDRDVDRLNHLVRLQGDLSVQGIELVLCAFPKESADWVTEKIMCLE